MKPNSDHNMQLAFPVKKFFLDFKWWETYEQKRLRHRAELLMPSQFLSLRRSLLLFPEKNLGIETDKLDFWGCKKKLILKGSFV